MLKVSSFIENIGRYGNCSVCIHTSSSGKVKSIIDFRVNDSGKLDAVNRLNDKVIDTYNEKELSFPLVFALQSLLLSKNSYVTFDDSLKKNDTEHATKIIYDMASKILSEISISDLTNWIDYSENIILNSLNKASSYESDFFSVSRAVENIKRNERIYLENFHKVVDTWKIMNNARSRDEYEVACENWNNLSNNSKMK